MTTKSILRLLTSGLRPLLFLLCVSASPRLIAQQNSRPIITDTNDLLKGFSTNLFHANAVPLNNTLQDTFNVYSNNFSFRSNITVLAETNQSLTATQYTAADINKKLVSTIDGSGWTNLNATRLASGTVADARLSANVPLLDHTNVFAVPQSLWAGWVSNSPGISGDINSVSNGAWFSGFGQDLSTSNLVNHGNAISSLGSGFLGEQFGQAASASGGGSTAVGHVALATGDESVAVGTTSTASGLRSTAIGQNTTASGDDSSVFGTVATATADSSMALGAGSGASADNAIAIGVNAVASHTNSVAIGTGSATTATNQIMLGAAGISTRVQNDLTVQTNLSVAGGLTVTGSSSNANFAGKMTLTAHADIAFTRYAVGTLTDSNNAAVPVGTNTFIEVSGPAAAFNINGIANGRDGKIIYIINQTGQDMTFVHQSGVDPTAANRIITMTGANRSTTANGAATLIYSGAAARWILISLDP